MSKKVLLLFLVALVIGVFFFYQNFILENYTFNRHCVFERQIFQSGVVKDSLDVHLNDENLKERQYPSNLPKIYLNNLLKRPTRFNKTCAKFPFLFDIKYKNDLWQLQKTSNGTYHLFSAYLDERNGSMIRILGTYDDQHQPTHRFYCQLWYNGTEKPVIVLADPLLYLFRKEWLARTKSVLHHPYIITCPLPQNERKVPVSVSLVENFCDNPSNNLRVLYKKVKEKKNFVVCVKGLNYPFEDKTVRLAEWIELLFILGAEKINFYEFKVHPSTKKLLNYYVDEDRIEVTPLTLVGDYSNYPFLQNSYLHSKSIERRLQEVIPFNDCLYKHIQEFKYVVILDIDEVIVPVNGTWVELMDTMQKKSKNRSSYLARNVYFLDSYQHVHDWFEGIPKYMHMLQHVHRAVNYTPVGYFVKGFHDTSTVIGLHNHFPFFCYRGCTSTEVNVTLAHLQHYRRDCASGVSSCAQMKKSSVMDFRIWNYKDELIERVRIVLRHLKMSSV